MSVLKGSWADLGYRKLGPLPVSGSGLTPAQLADRLTHVGDYEATADHWVRRHARRKGTRFPESIEVVALLDKDTVLDDDRLAFVDQHAVSKWVKTEEGWIRIRAELEALTRSVARAETSKHRWQGMYRLTNALLYAGPEHLRMVFRRHVAPCFFKLYPQGKIVVLRYDTGVDETAALLRTMYALAQTPLPGLTHSGFKGIRTLQTWHSFSLAPLLPRLLNLFNYLFYPFVGGVRGGPPGLDFLFLFDPPEQHALMPFPRNWLGIPSGSASFGKEDFDPVEIITDFHGSAHQRASHQRYQHTHSFTIGERVEFLRWYIRQLNRLLYELVDVANFTKDHEPQAVVDPVFGFEHLLTIDRLLRKTILAMSLDEAPAGNLMVFEIADLYDTLSERFENRKTNGNLFQKMEFFKTFFDTQEGPAMIAPRFAHLPTPFDKYLSDLTMQVYGKIEETVLRSVWLSSKVTPQGVLVRNEDLSQENPMAVPKFVGEVMRAYRNAHHGYFSADPASKNRPSRFLFLVDGNLPVEMSALPILWWLAYLAEPRLIGWNHLEINAYD